MARLIAHDFSVDVQRVGEDEISYIVRGYVTCPTAGWVLTLEPGNEGINPQPERAVLDLEAREPTGPVTEVITEEPATYAGIDDAALRVIEIRLGDDIETPEGEKTILLETVVTTTH